MGTVIVAIVFAVFDVVMAYYCYKAYRKHTALGTYLGRTFIASNLVLWAYTLNYFSKSETVMSVCCCLEHALMDWAIFFFMLFCYVFTGHYVRKKLNYTLIGVLVVDSVLIATNAVNRMSFDIEILQGFFNDLAQAVPKTFFVVHAIICIFMILFTINSLILKITRTSKYYTTRYWMVLWLLVTIVLLYSLYMLSPGYRFDYSLVFYGIGVILVYQATYAFSPTNLLARLQAHIDAEISEATISYDIEGEVLRINEPAKNMLPKDVWCSCDELKHYLGDVKEEGKYRVYIDLNIYEVNYKPIYDEKGIYVASSFIFHDVTEAEHQLEREHRAAVFDPLTQVYNRQGFFEEVKKFLANDESNACYAILISGICNFKGINGLYGTRTGDRVLKTIAEKYQEFRHAFQMIYGRTAEGKFACLIPFEYVEEVVGELSSFPMALSEDMDIHVDMCHGFAVIKRDGVRFEEYYELALMALAKCKQVAKTVVEYSQDMADELQRQQLLLSETHNAVEDREFFIELQPQIDLKAQKVSGAEALVRWNHPTLGRINPAEFIPLFEGNGYITKVDHFVWDEAAATIAKLSDAGLYNGPISVNVSQVDIMNTDVVKELLNIVKKYGIPVDRLHVEITESACVDNREKLIRTLSELRQNGFIVEIDDFGSGYSSLNALMRLPFDIVKLDMVFMQSHKVGEKSDIVMRAITNMLHEMNAEIIVEGVETKENMDTASLLKADVAQGYFYSKPISVQAFVDYVKGFDKQ